MQGKTISGYTLKHQLGVGGMAEVWLGENAIGKKAAVKLLLPKFCNDEAIVARFENEAKVMVQLDHPNIRQVYDYGNINGRPTIIMEYLEGDDLKALMKSGRRFTDNELRKWWNQIVDALNYTHAKGVVHRDIKPSNIFIDEKGDVKLLDFGIAKVVDVTSGTMTGSTLGTRIYMSPEQVKDPKRVDYRTDLYSLAVTFVHLLKGKAPYDSTTSSDFDIQVSIVSKPLDISSLSEEWRGFLAPYLEKEPQQRPELRHFEEVKPASKPFVVPVAEDDEGTVVESQVPKPKSEPMRSGQKKELSEPIKAFEEEPKSKKGIWIGVGVVAAVVLLLVVLMKPKKEEPLMIATDTGSEAYQTSYSVEQAEAEAERKKREQEEYDRKQLQITIRDEYVNLLEVNRINGSDYDEGYFLYDIDRNGIPELWIKNGTCEADYMMHVYTYKNGIKKIGDIGAGHIGGYYKGNGYLLRTMGHMGYYYIGKVSYDGYSLNETIVYEEEYDFENEISIPTGGDEKYADEIKTETEINLYPLTDKQPILNAFRTE